MNNIYFEVVFFFRLCLGISFFEWLFFCILFLSWCVKLFCVCVKKGNCCFNICDVKLLLDMDKGGKFVKFIKVWFYLKKFGWIDNRDYDLNFINYVFKFFKVKYCVFIWLMKLGIIWKKVIRYCKREILCIVCVCKKVVSVKKLKVMIECVIDIKVSCYSIDFFLWIFFFNYNYKDFRRVWIIEWFFWFNWSVL